MFPRMTYSENSSNVSFANGEEGIPNGSHHNFQKLWLAILDDICKFFAHHANSVFCHSPFVCELFIDFSAFFLLWAISFVQDSSMRNWKNSDTVSLEEMPLTLVFKFYRKVGGNDFALLELRNQYHIFLKIYITFL